MIYTPELISLAYLRLHRTMSALETDDDALLREFIAEASTEFQQATGRTFIPYAATHTYDYGREHLYDAYTLHLGEDLLSVTSITNVSALAGSDYVLQPSNELPKHFVRKRSAAWVSGTDGFAAITVAGIWGYAPHYVSAWKSTGVTLSGNANDSVTTIPVASTTAFSPLQWLKVGSEVMQVNSVSGGLQVFRAQLGTTAAAHNSGAAISAWQPLPDVASAVREMAAYKYKHKDSLGARVTVFDGGVVSSEDLARSVGETIQRYQWRSEAETP